MTRFQDRLEQQQNAAEKRLKYLERQSRREHARYQHEYLEHMREQQIRLHNQHDFDYRNDPYFHTAPIYRYYRGGRYFDVNQYAADVLRLAVNNGYEEGYFAGRADMMDRWAYDYEDCYAYEDATYGYSGYYVDLNEYRYYFREGFRRGYDDGYYDSTNYGRHENGKYVILVAILARILYLIPLH